jgi:putative MATE family efflux protein
MFGNRTKFLNTRVIAMADELELVEEGGAIAAPPPPTEQGQEISRTDLRKRVVALAGPSVVELVLSTLFGMVDMMMVGGVGPAAIAAVGMSNQPMFLGLAVFQALNVGTTAVVARSIGAKNIDDANEATRQTLIITLVLGALISVLGIVFAEPIIAFMGAEPDVLPIGTRYFQIVSGGLIFQAITMGLSAVLRGAGDTKTPMKLNLIANCANVFGNYVLINGALGFPHLFTAGAAWSTTISRLVAAVLMLRVVYSGKFVINLKRSQRFTLRWDLIGRIVKVGTPAAIEQFIMRFGMIAFTKVVAGLGTDVYAAHQIAINITSLSFTPGQAFGMAATTLIGQNLGAKRPDIAEAAGWETRRLGMYVACTMGAIFFLFGGWLGRLYSSAMTVVADVALALRVIAFVQPFQSTQFILAGGLRGAGDTKWPLISTTVGVAGVRVALAYLFVNGLHLGLLGAWLAMACDQTARTFVIYFRYRSGHWKKVAV